MSFGSSRSLSRVYVVHVALCQLAWSCRGMIESVRFFKKYIGVSMQTQYWYIYYIYIYIGRKIVESYLINRMCTSCLCVQLMVSN